MYVCMFLQIKVSKTKATEPSTQKTKIKTHNRLKHDPILFRQATQIAIVRDNLCSFCVQKTWVYNRDLNTDYGSHQRVGRGRSQLD